MSAPFVHIRLEQVADVLDMLGREIEALGLELCASPDLAAAHLHHLQDIDRIAQYQHALARILRADCPASAIRELGLDDLAARLGG